MARQQYVQGSTARKLKTKRKTNFTVLHQNFEKAEVEQLPVRESKYSWGHVILVLLCLGFIGTALTGYIWLNSDIIQYQKQCANLEREYESLKTSNDLYLDRINNSVDMAEIERIAVCELGMKLAGEGQIVVYSGEIEDYVKQYADIP